MCAHLQAVSAQRKHTKEQLRSKACKVFEEAATIRLDNAALDAVNRITKKCPKAGCGMRIERIEGCAHFRCKNCNVEFCWVCKVIWPQGKPLHVDGCRLGTKSRTPRSKLDLSQYASGWDKDEGYDLFLDMDKQLILIARHQ